VLRDSGRVEPSKSESAGGTWTFGRFRLITTRQLLLRDGVPVPIGSRALDILTVLVRRSGELVSKHELTAAVWPDTFVDESNLKVNVCLLRRSLGDTRKQPMYIATIAGRGYRFVAPVQRAHVQFCRHP
jgi:DNA-binding winged helix-turn-helix (wHTH) protein